MTASYDLERYVKALSESSPEQDLVTRIPWLPDGIVQPPRQLLATLRGDARRFAELPNPARFSVVTPLWNTDPRMLGETIASVSAQSWPYWELILVDDGSTRREHLDVARWWAARDARIRLVEREQNGGISAARNEGIARATGEFVFFLDHDDLIHPSALGIFGSHVVAMGNVDLLYANEAIIDATSRDVVEFLSKPELDLFTLFRVNYVCHPLAIRRDLLLDLDRREGAIFRSCYDGVEDHDLLLRLSRRDLRSVHVPLFLYYWRKAARSTAAAQDVEPVLERGRAMLGEHLALRYPHGFRLFAPFENGSNSRFSIQPLVPRRGRPVSLSVVIPFRDHAEMTIVAIESIERQVHSLAVDVVLVDNDSTPETVERLQAWTSLPRRASYRLVHYRGAFNFARINNTAIRDHARGELVLLMNNDVELLSPECLEVMAAHLLTDERAAFVGIKLLYGEDAPGRPEVQHGGIEVVGDFAGSGYFPIGHARTEAEFVHDERIVLGVTFACAMTRRATWESLGGLDEILLPNGFGDVDLCARAIERGLRNYYLGTLVGAHRESRSRGRVCEEVETTVLHERHSATFARWRLRRLVYDLQPAWVRRTRNVAVPLRYQIADRLNDKLKAVLGPAHNALKLRLLRRAQKRNR